MNYRTILITGTNGGLGSFLKKEIEDPICVTRENPLTTKVQKSGVDLIIHCAFNSDLDSLQKVTKKSYIDNIELTSTLVKIPHKKFVYISSSHIAPYHKTPYAIFKKISEHIIEENCENYCILRPSCLLGDNMKYNTFSKIVDGKDITLTSDSVNDAILYEDVFNAIQLDLKGNYFLKSREIITMGEVANLYNKKIKYGKFYYNVGDIKSDIDTGKTSKETLLRVFNK
jgi:dTDP-4-dehydrorhamnose reductase|tara:strand:+ start:3862 stop:4545 length:684 start_codon:yes stop_codon:yes gene_type:complete